MKRKLQINIARWLRSAVAATLWLALLAVFSNPLPLHAQDPETEEYKIKVAYIYNFARYVRWPGNALANANAPFVLGILGDAPFGDALQQLDETRKIHDRRIVVRRFKTPQEYVPCQILFVTKTVEAKEMQEIADHTKRQYVLIVGELPGLTDQGATINFYFDQADDTIGFIINVDSLKQRHLAVDARLLKLARIEGGNR